VVLRRAAHRELTKSGEKSCIFRKQRQISETRDYGWLKWGFLAQNLVFFERTFFGKKEVFRQAKIHGDCQFPNVFCSLSY